MKLSKIARITRKYRTLDVIDVGGRQWVSIGPAAYALDGAPPIREAGELLTMMDVPGPEQEGYLVTFTRPEAGFWIDLLDEGMEADADVREGGILVCWRGVVHVPLLPEAGGPGVWYSELYARPFEDEENVTLHLREVDGRRWILARRGLSLIAVLAPRVVSEEMREAVRECAARGFGGDDVEDCEAEEIGRQERLG